MAGRVKDSRQKWIAKGYVMMANEGQDNIQAKWLARMENETNLDSTIFSKTLKTFLKRHEITHPVNTVSNHPYAVH
jgi:hypothetical protein